MPWDDWFHIMGHTYGTWLPGDAKGFRTRQHREHVDGDYRSPPPVGKYDGLRRHAQNLMKREPVHLDVAQRRRAVDELVRSFEKWQIELRILSIDSIHIHALARVPDHNPRHWMGLAKKECSAYMRQDGLAPAGGLWAVRCACKPILDEMHYANSIGYISDHAEAGAVVYEPPVDGLEGFNPDSLLL